MKEYNEIERIAAELEAKLNVLAGEHSTDEEYIQDGIDDQVEKEKENAKNLPEPSLPACAKSKDDEGGVVEEKTVLKCGGNEEKMANLRRLAHEVRISSKMTDSEKSIAFAKIHKVAKGISIRKNDLTKMLSTDVTKIMKSISGINSLVQDERREKHTLRQAVSEMKKWGRENGVDIAFPENLLGRSLGSFSTSDILELGPRIATMLQEYKAIREKTESENKQSDETGDDGDK